MQDPSRIRWTEDYDPYSARRDPRDAHRQRRHLLTHLRHLTHEYQGDLIEYGAWDHSDPHEHMLAVSLLAHQQEPITAVRKAIATLDRIIAKTAPALVPSETHVPLTQTRRPSQVSGARVSRRPTSPQATRRRPLQPRRRQGGGM